MTPRILSTFLSLLIAGAAFGAPLSLRVVPPETMDAGRRMEWRVVVTNSGATAAVDIPIHFWGEGYTDIVVDRPEGCTPESSGVACKRTIPAGGSVELRFVREAKREVGRFGGAAAIYAADPRLVEVETAIIGFPFVVTNVEDSGPGSLRQAIVDLNRECAGLDDPCSVVFSLDGPPPAEGWWTIRLESALPKIVARDFFFDGHSQARRTGETNGAGPEIVLDGSAAREGHGLQIASFRADVRDVAIGGFPQNGIDTRSGVINIQRAWLGVDGSGVKALPNGWRGLQVDQSMIAVSNCILSGNRYSGGYFWSNADVTVRRNLVGVGADGVTPVGNGASGLFFHNPAMTYRFSNAYENVIAHNGGAGIALSRLGPGNYAANVIRNNIHGAIDIGLDGPTLEPTMGNPGQGGIIGPPILTSARYANGVTTVEGRIQTRPGGVIVGDVIYVYANSREAAEAEELVGTVTRLNAGTFTLQVPRDLRGQWVTASQYSIYVYNWDDPAPGTSEISLPRLVE